MECYVDTDFARGWDIADPNNASNLMSRTGFLIKYTDRPIYWKSKLQTEIVLSTAEAEYIALSSALREVIPLLAVMEEIALKEVIPLLIVMEEISNVFPLMMNQTNFFCKVWEDNQSCIAIVTSQKCMP